MRGSQLVEFRDTHTLKPPCEVVIQNSAVFRFTPHKSKTRAHFLSSLINKLLTFCKELCVLQNKRPQKGKLPTKLRQSKQLHGLLVGRDPTVAKHCFIARESQILKMILMIICTTFFYTKLNYFWIPALNQQLIVFKNVPGDHVPHVRRPSQSGVQPFEMSFVKSDRFYTGYCTPSPSEREHVWMGTTWKSCRDADQSAGCCAWVPLHQHSSLSHSLSVWTTSLMH